MCGFVGYVGESPLPTDRLIASRDAMHTRGPDASGLFERHYPRAAVGLGFRRLRILDLSSAADQPMERDGLWMVFNGEIYNFADLREELKAKGHRFKTTGDSEVILAAYQQWGRRAIERLEGMFALALWDPSSSELLLARDRLGIKPLYYSHRPGNIVFGSHPKAVLHLGGLDARARPESIEKFLTFLWVPDPDTLFEGIYKLPPGHLAVFSPNDFRTHQYWDMTFEPGPETVDDHVHSLRESIRSSVRRQLASDVPLGVFLSGGVDSTLIARFAAEESPRPVLAIATGFEESARRNEVGGDDLAFARLAAQEIPNLDYHEIVLTENSADLANDLVSHFDDPVADPAAIASNLICSAAKPRATVMLSGVGAEELFGGYPRHRAVAWGSRISRLPLVARRALLGPAAALMNGARPGPGMQRMRHLKKLTASLAEPHPYIAFCAHHTPTSLSSLVGHRVDWESVASAHYGHLHTVQALPPLSQALYLDLKTYLPALNLAYTDRASMAASVEVRVPLLDELVLAQASRIPDSLKVRNGTGKFILKQAARGLVPESILTRPKTGFGGPVRTWIRNLSGEVIPDCLSRSSIQDRGFVSPNAVAQMHRDFLAGKADYSLQLWAVVSLELWARSFLDQGTLSSISGRSRTSPCP